MGWIEDVLKELPLSAVLKERVALADQKHEAALREVEQLKQKVAALERENAQLRAQHADTAGSDFALSDDTARVLVHLFKTDEMDDRDVGAMTRALGMERGVLQYHLERLDEAKLAEMIGGNYVTGEVYWALTPKGRQHVVERKLI